MKLKKQNEAESGMKPKKQNEAEKAE